MSDLEKIEAVSTGTRSLVPLDFDQLQSNEKPSELNYQGRQVLLLRRLVSGSIADLTLAEARVLIAENAPEEEL